ncbi:MAG: nuclear transport factor 2 family protein [Acidobacteriaceae bacterium]|nr:nuclear transport factor 2 family protein [Acidobacteriaceae bacterium]
MMNDLAQLLSNMYDEFNARNMEAVLAFMHPEVDWPNGWEGGRLNGKAAVRDYWVRQWAAITPTVEPQKITALPDGRVAVGVHQRVLDRDGNLLLDQIIHHIYTFEGNLVRKMDIEDWDSTIAHHSTE